MNQHPDQGDAKAGADASAPVCGWITSSRAYALADEATGGNSAASAHADDGAAPADGVAPSALDEVFELSDPRLGGAVEAVREITLHDGAVQAEKLRRLAYLAGIAESATRRRLAASPRVSSQPDDLLVIDAAVTSEVQAALGSSACQTGWMLELARRLTGVLTDTLTALEEGRLDLYRARVLSEATTVCSDAVARQVEATVLPAAGSAGWEVPGPRAWRVRVERAVVKADAHAALERRRRAVVERELRTWPDRDGTGVLWLRTALEDITLAERVVSGLAHAGPTHDPQGNKLSMDQRRVDVIMDLLRRVHDGQPLPGLGQHRQSMGGQGLGGQGTDGPGASGGHGRGQGRGREVGLVLHTDTHFGNGAAATDPGQLRGLGVPAPIDSITARQLAETQIGAGAPTRVLLTDTHGALQRVVRLGLTPGQHRWTRQTLSAAVRAVLPDLPALRTDTYAATAAIVEHVHARNPHCAAYDCPRVAARCDLDHDRPWPRGPTEVTNLQPRCRRHHELKTRGLVTTRLRPDGTVMTRMLTGLTVTAAPEPLPGHAPGEGYHQS